MTTVRSAFYASVAGFAVFMASPCLGQTALRPYMRNNLRGLESVIVAIDLSPLLTKVGVREQRVTTGCELSLRKAGLKVANAKSIDPKGLDGSIFLVEVAGTEIQGSLYIEPTIYVAAPVVLANRKEPMFVVLWKTTVRGSAALDRTRDAEAVVLDAVDEFVNDWMAANKTRR